MYLLKPEPELHINYAQKMILPNCIILFALLIDVFKFINKIFALLLVLNL
jgi:hypothetical protein